MKILGLLVNLGLRRVRAALRAVDLSQDVLHSLQECSAAAWTHLILVPVRLYKIGQLFSGFESAQFAGLAHSMSLAQTGVNEVYP